MKKLLLVFLAMSLVLSCSLVDDSTTEAEPEITTPATPENPVDPVAPVDPLTPVDPVAPVDPVTPPTVVQSRGQVHDSSGNLIGHLINAYAGAVELITANGYMVRVDWNGNIVEGNYMEYSEVDAGGLSMNYMSYNSVYAKEVKLFRNVYYIYKDDNGDGLSEPDTSITVCNSTMNSSGTIENYPYNLDQDENAFIYVAVDRSTIDYPTTVSGPLVLSFE